MVSRLFYFINFRISHHGCHLMASKAKAMLFAVNFVWGKIGGIEYTMSNECQTLCIQGQFNIDYDI